jgi:hypothetical protein
MQTSKRYGGRRVLALRTPGSAAACVALALPALAAGCGSSSGGHATATSSTAARAANAAFVARAVAICTKPGPATGPFPYPSFQPLHPNVSELPAIGRYFEHANALSTLRSRLAELHALGSPAADSSDWQALLAAKQANINAAAAQYRAALASDARTFVTTVKSITAAAEHERAAASRVRAPACAPPAEGQQTARPPGPAPRIPPQARLALTQLAACMTASGVPVRANTSGSGPPLTTSVSPSSAKYVAAADRCRARLAARFPGLARNPPPP